MDKSKKLVISLTAVAVVAVAAIVSLVVVLAAFTTTTTNTFSVSYSAAGVEATVTAQYRKATVAAGAGNYTTIQSSDNQNSITFSRQETGGSSNSTVTKSFKDLANVAISKTEFFVMKYTIQNTSNSIAINVNLSLPGTPNNFARTYHYATNATDPTSNALASITGGTASFSQQTIAAGATGYIYVVFAISNADIDASFTGTSTWTLTAA